MGFLQRVFGKKKSVPEKTPGGISFNIKVVDAGSLDGVSDAIRQIYHLELDGIIVKNVLSPEELESTVARMNNWESDMIDEAIFGRVYGEILAATNEDLDRYLGQVEPLEADLVRMFGGRSYPSIVEPVLTQMAGGRTVKVPEIEGRGKCKGATVRFMYPGKADIEPHVGNEFITELRQFELINGLMELKDQLSYFMLLQKPEKGGELILYDLSWKDTPRELVERHGITRAREERKAYLRGLERQELVLDAGDLILFHGGRIWHMVKPAEGERDRVTIGGFAAISRNDEYVYYWA